MKHKPELVQTQKRGLRPTKGSEQGKVWRRTKQIATENTRGGPRGKGGPEKKEKHWAEAKHKANKDKGRTPTQLKRTNGTLQTYSP